MGIRLVSGAMEDGVGGTRGRDPSMSPFAGKPQMEALPPTESLWTGWAVGGEVPGRVA